LLRMKGGRVVQQSDKPATTSGTASTAPAGRSREGWRPIGKALADNTIHEDGAPRKPLSGPAPTKEKGTYRTEFVVFFIWKEPIEEYKPPMGPAVAPKGDAPPATGPGAAGKGPETKGPETK